MAEYKNADRLIEIFKKMEKQSDIFDHGTILAAIAAIEIFPADDVAPRAEVAREIFAEMQSCLIQRHWNGLDIVSFEFDAVKYAELKKKYTGE